MATLYFAKIFLLNLTLALFIFQTFAATRRPQVLYDVHGNLLASGDVKYPASNCCLVPTCESPSRCFQTSTCGRLCSSGRYPPSEYPPTPGYKLRDMYSKYDCRFEVCMEYAFKCSHCQDPNESGFSIYMVREDCKDCYYY